MAKATIGRNAEALAKSHEERHALEGELDQMHNVAQLVVSEVFGLTPSTSTPTIRLAEVPDKVWALISNGMFYGTSEVLTSVVTHHPNLDFAAIYSGYANGWSPEAIHALKKSLLPHAQLVAEQVSVQWVMDARRANTSKARTRKMSPSLRMAWSPARNRMLSCRRTSSPYFRRSRRQPMPLGSHN